MNQLLLVDQCDAALAKPIDDGAAARSKFHTPMAEGLEPQFDSARSRRSTLNATPR
jgi:hypothetical protein